MHASVCIFRACCLWKLSVSVIKHHSTIIGTHRLPGTIFFMTLLLPPKPFVHLEHIDRVVEEKYLCLLATSGIYDIPPQQF